MNLFYLLTSLLFSLFLRLFFGLQCKGRFPKIRGGAVIVANHHSFLDPMVLCGSCFPHLVHFLARKTLFSHFPLGLFLRLNKVIALDQTNPSEALLHAIFLVKCGHKVALFPEGTRSRDGRLREGKRGIGLIVCKTRCPIVPVYIKGTYKAWKQGRRFPRLFTKVRCVFGEPIFWEQCPEQSHRDSQMWIVREVMRRLDALQREEE